MKTIEIIISPTGQATVQTKGFAGSSCQEASRFLEQALGARVSGERTAEYYQTESARQNAQEGA
jgi:Protein of unknown function (DUF2997)